ncbi:hypothetical protein GCM10009718_32870 [Isoptericola halotolerans]|uniref:Uncharacterized protein n=1 Tax=Isoptericola halotolerans TaxID=300560 RepID=A0ABX2A645_9MICO|nr:hypothetical protein [Isoptericola halotolerans]NOV98175.1 hypothetical protein [Isoptericola halotolerans]
MGTATLIRDVSKNFAGHAALYRLDPPLRTTDYATDEPVEYEHVIVSATAVIFSGPETYIFPGDPETDQVTSWGELGGSYRGGLDHAEALRGAGDGYDIAATEA